MAAHGYIFAATFTYIYARPTNSTPINQKNIGASSSDSQMQIIFLAPIWRPLVLSFLLGLKIEIEYG